MPLSVNANVVLYIPATTLMERLKCDTDAEICMGDIQRAVKEIAAFVRQAFPDYPEQLGPVVVCEGDADFCTTALFDCKRWQRGQFSERYGIAWHKVVGGSGSWRNSTPSASFDLPASYIKAHLTKMELLNSLVEEWGSIANAKNCVTLCIEASASTTRYDDHEVQIIEGEEEEDAAVEASPAKRAKVENSTEVGQ